MLVRTPGYRSHSDYSLSPNCSSWITSRLPVIPPGIMRSGYLAQQVKVGLATGARIDDGGKVAGIIEGIPGVIQTETERKLQSCFGLSDKLAILPFLTVEDHAALFGYSVNKGFEVGRKPEAVGDDPWKQSNAFFVGDGNFVDAGFIAPAVEAEQIFSVRGSVDGAGAVRDKKLRVRAVAIRFPNREAVIRRQCGEVHGLAVG